MKKYEKDYVNPNPFKIVECPSILYVLKMSLMFTQYEGRIGVSDLEVQNANNLLFICKN